MSDSLKPEGQVKPETVLGVAAVAAPAAETVAPNSSEVKLDVRPVTKSPNFMASRRVLPELIESSIERGVRVVLTKAGYEIDGFYKLGPMRLEPGEKGGLVAIDRKDKMVAIQAFDDLVRLNYDCWKKSRDKGAAYINPGKEWVEEFGRLGLVKRQVIFVPGDD